MTTGLRDGRKQKTSPTVYTQFESRDMAVRALRTGLLSGLFPRTNQAKSLQGAIYDSSPRNLNATVILNGIDGTIGSIRVRTAAERLSGRLSREKDGLTWVDASFRIPDVSIGTEALTVVASGVNGSALCALMQRRPGPGTFEVQSLTLDDYALPGDLGIRLGGNEPVGRYGQWPVLGEEAIVAHATLDRIPRPDAETLRVRVPSFNVERGSRLTPGLRINGWNVTGRIGLEGTCPRSQHAERGMRILVEDAALSKAAIAVEDPRVRWSCGTSIRSPPAEINAFTSEAPIREIALG